MRALVEACRPRQWVKNLFVAAPLVFAKRLNDPHLFLRALFAVAVFCAVSSAVYLWNDIVDVDKDRAHPLKRARPIASGRLPLGTARIAFVVLAVSAVAASFVVGWRFSVCVLLYLINNFAYSLKLKHVVYLDVISIAAAVHHRDYAGVFADNVVEWP
jgi:4-hydroxybenzoate polyprenyltransferase